MNAKQLFAASFIALGASAAMADDITIDNTPFVSTKTRAEVKAEVLQAVARGDVLSHGELYPMVEARQIQSTLSRDAVRADVQAANREGQLAHAGELLFKRDL